MNVRHGCRLTESMWTSKLPSLQRAWDATSLNALMFCPRYYQYTIVAGYRSPGQNLNLEFGGYFASTVERYKKALLNGSTKQQATLIALRYAIEATWLPDSGPWSGRYEHAWRCTGTVPYRNQRGNRAKCPYSRAHVWLPEPAPDACSCGSPIEQQERWVSDGTKDRYALVRLVAAYCDAQPETPADGPWPITIGSQPAVELSFRYPIPYKTPDGEPYLLAGHMDSIMRFGAENFISDNKTTTKSLNAKYWAGYSPNTQVDLYDVTGQVMWPAINIRGVIIEGAQLTKNLGPRLGIGIIRRTDALRSEFMEELGYWLAQAETFAKNNYWPMNRRNCWACEFAEICAKDPDKRHGYLEANFIKREWNPLQER